MDEGPRKLEDPNDQASDAGAILAAGRNVDARPEADQAIASDPSETGVVETRISDSDASSSGIVSHLQSVAGPVAGAISSMIEMATQGMSLGQAVIERRLRRLAHDPLPNLYELYPAARLASPHELGFRFVPVEEIRGTAVAGAAQRGGDFLPLRPFRGENWEARWQRILWANERMQPLPPVDLIKYDGDYWVVDGHNRVAATLYSHGVGLDAMVTELVPLDGQTSEQPRSLLAYLGEMGELRAAVQGRRPAMGLRQAEMLSGDEASGLTGGASSAVPERGSRDEAADLHNSRPNGPADGDTEGTASRKEDLR